MWHWESIAEEWWFLRFMLILFTAGFGCCLKRSRHIHWDSYSRSLLLHQCRFQRHKYRGTWYSSHRSKRCSTHFQCWVRFPKWSIFPSQKWWCVMSCPKPGSLHRWCSWRWVQSCIGKNHCCIELWGVYCRGDLSIVLKHGQELLRRSVWAGKKGSFPWQ